MLPHAYLNLIKMVAGREFRHVCCVASRKRFCRASERMQISECGWRGHFFGPPLVVGDA